TGDLVRRLPDGDFDFLGRLDHQVKIRGMRVELGEIESVLGRHPGVREAVTLVREDRPGDRRLAAYVVVAAAGETLPPSAGELRESLERELPAYMVPQDWVFLGELPLTPNDKVDRRALPAPERQVETAAAPRTPLEQSLAGIFREVFGLETVSVHDDFFALGGHSLLATQVVARVRRLLGVDLEIRVLFEDSTIEGLARRIEAEGYEARESFASPRTPLEELIAEIWSEVLSLDRVGVHDNFWDLGGRPPLAAEVLSRVNESFGIELPPQALESSPTIAGLTAAIGEILLAEELDDLEPTGMGKA
ncbi:MAG: phosphopantetheine-binding protein, partial [Thermoanaerobaculia bacterium]